MSNRTNALKFNAKIDQFHIKTQAKLDKVVQGVGLALAEEIIVGRDFSPGTPILTGYARASWWISVDSKDRTTTAPEPLAKGDKASKGMFGDGSEALSAALLSLLTARIGSHVYILNNCIYINTLEYDGHSKQAPEGFVRLTLSHAQEIVNKVVQNLGT